MPDLTPGLKPLGTVVRPRADNSTDAQAKRTEQPRPTLSSSATVGHGAERLLRKLVLPDRNTEEVVRDTGPEEQRGDESGQRG